MPVTEKDLLAQVCLPTEVGECKAFTPNRFRCNFCTGCGRLISKHAAEIIPDNSTLRAVSLELTVTVGILEYDTLKV